MLQAGQTIAHFKIVKKLGEGGMGEVYLAEDTKLTRQVAIKILSEEVFEDSEREERFQREARTAAQISHPNVTSIHDIGTASDPDSGKEINYIVMEYVRGKSLSAFIEQESPDLGRLIRVAEKIAAGLSAAHQMNIVHRDIKAENVLIDDDERIKILDFGLAKPVDPLSFDKSGKKSDNTASISQELTRAGKILGTVSYMSPEQVQGKSVDNRSDIFSFGILMYRMFTGESPFTGETQVSTMAKILETQHEAPRVKNTDIPLELERIIDKCLQKDPNDRYQDTRDLVVDLRNLRRQHDSGVTGAITAITDRPEVGKSKSFFSTWPGVTVLALVLIFGGLGVIFVAGAFDGALETFNASKATANPEATLAIIGFENKTGDESLDWLETGLPEILLTDLSQSQDLQIISQQRIVDCLPADQRTSHTYAQCVDAAQELGAGRILSGSFFKMGDRIRIDARLEDIGTGKIVFGEKVIGDDPFVLVDSLTTKIASLMNLGTMAKVNIMASKSPEAFKQYHLGMEHFWRGEDDSATANFEQAIAIDSTFALPYMRLGMVNVFDGKTTAGAQYFKMAKQFEDRLPIRERRLLDAYYDTWAEVNFDHAYEKMEDLLRDYPEDAEIRTIYSLFVDAFHPGDTAVVFAHLDTVLQAYPNFPLALEQYSILAGKYENYGKAIAMAKQFREAVPETPGPLLRLARLYEQTGQVDKAYEAASEIHDRFPEKEEPLYLLIDLSIKRRDFAAARQFTETLRSTFAGDHFDMRGYYNIRAGLANWRGEFLTGIEFRHKALDEAQKTNDSNLIWQACQVLGSYYFEFNQPDSGLYYYKRGAPYAQTFAKTSYPMALVMYDTANAEEARALFKEAIADMRSRVPKEFWALPDRVEDIFEARAKADTTALIAAFEGLVEAQEGDAQTGNRIELGAMLVLTGEYQRGLEQLEILLDGRHESTSGWTYPKALYYSAVAHDELGDDQRAAEQFQELLGYWSDPEIQLDMITDARTRLGRLTS